jgi:hypothetical protein
VSSSSERQTVAAKFGLKNSFSVKASTDPSDQLTAEILDAATVCAAHFESLASEIDTAAAQSANLFFALASEFAAAFTWLALSLTSIREQQDVLRHKLLFLLPEDVKNAFLAREPVYSACAATFVPDKPLAGDGVVNKLALRVADICGSRYNPELLRQCVVVFADVSSVLELRQRVRDCL